MDGAVRVQGRVGEGLGEAEPWFPKAGGVGVVSVQDATGLTRAEWPGGQPLPPQPVVPGAAVVAVAGPEARVVLDGEAFTVYLDEEGLEDVILARAEAGTTAAPAREVYRRCLKVVVGSGDARAQRRSADAVTTRVGLDLELVPLKDPRAARPGSLATYTLWYRGAPLEGRRVRVAWLEGTAERRVSGMTDARGRVTLEVPDAAWWVVSTVHMVPADRIDADWQSTWAALTVQR